MKNPASHRANCKPRRWPLRGLLLSLLLAAPAAIAAQSAGASEAGAGSSYSAQWGPGIGARLPLLDAADQSGTRRALGDLVGRKGLLLVLVRSADW